MGKTILLLVGFIIAVIGVICIFDARILTKKIFSFGDQNEGSMGLKIFGFIFFITGSVIIFFNIY